MRSSSQTRTESGSGGQQQLTPQQRQARLLNQQQRQNQLKQQQQQQQQQQQKPLSNQQQTIQQNKPKMVGQQQQNRPSTGGIGTNQQQRPINSNNNNNNRPQQQNPMQPPLPPVLPKGWKKEEVMRKNGISSGIFDIVYVPPPPPSATSGATPAAIAAATELRKRRFRSKLEMQRHFGSRYDMSLLDFRSGKLSQVVWRKQRRLKSIQAALNAPNPTSANNYLTAAKYDNYLNVPIRSTASIFKQPVSLVTNNHKNDPVPESIIDNPSVNKNNDRAKPCQVILAINLIFSEILINLNTFLKDFLGITFG
jgi:type II secretory pathway pseudopilin PulG